MDITSRIKSIYKYQRYFKSREFLIVFRLSLNSKPLTFDELYKGTGTLPFRKMNDAIKSLIMHNVIRLDNEVYSLVDQTEWDMPQLEERRKNSVERHNFDLAQKLDKSK